MIDCTHVKVFIVPYSRGLTKRIAKSISSCCRYRLNFYHALTYSLQFIKAQIKFNFRTF